MIVIIQCAATKSSNAGQFKTSSGQLIKFVADPSAAPPSNCLYARPDDASEQGPSWRQLLLQYNGRTGENPFGLLQALDLYENPAYGRVADKFGIENTYILSAGWGLIAGSFLTPDYDITFSQSADGYKRRRRSDFYRDLCMLPLGTSDPIFFFGGKDYIPLFATLTQSISAPKTVFYNSAVPPDAPGCSLKRFETSTRTNWHYECASAFMGAWDRQYPRDLEAGNALGKPISSVS